MEKYCQKPKFTNKHQSTRRDHLRRIIFSTLLLWSIYKYQKIDFLYLFSKIKLHLKNILAKIPKRSSLTWDFPKLLKRATMSRLTRMNDFCKKLQLYPKRSFYVLLSNQVPINYFFWYFKGAKTCWIECLLCIRLFTISKCNSKDNTPWES